MKPTKDYTAIHTLNGSVQTWAGINTVYINACIIDTAAVTINLSVTEAELLLAKLERAIQVAKSGRQSYTNQLQFDFNEHLDDDTREFDADFHEKPW